MSIDATMNHAVGGRRNMTRPHRGVQVLNWTLLAVSFAGALFAGIWTSGILLGEFLPESMLMPISGQAEDVLTVFDYMASIVAGLWIGYVIFFVLWECILKRVGMFFSVDDPFRRLLAKWK
jgi:hypothetical protein